DPDLKELTHKAQQGEVEYDPQMARRRQSELRYLNMKMAERNGAIIGAAVSTISHVVDFIRPDRERPADEVARSLQRILMGTADGAGRSGIIYLAADIFTKGNPAAAMPAMATANVVYDFSKDLYRLATGQIDADDLLVNTVTNAFSTVTSFGGVQLGTAVGAAAAKTAIGKAIGLGATIGTAAGPLGAIVGGAVLGLAAGLASGWVIGDARRGALERVNQDLEQLGRAAELNPRMVPLRFIDGMASL